MSEQYGCKIMCIVAHQDDEAQAAGAVLRETRQGNKVVVVWMTNGAKGWTLPGEITREEVIAVRRKEAEAALELLGAEGCFLDYEDGELAYEPETIKRVAKVIREYRPEIIVTHGTDTWHNDHNATSRIVTSAVSMASSRMTDLGSPRHITKSLYYFVVSRDAKPDFFLDISDMLEEKVAVRTIHKSQFPDSAEERYRAMAVVWGLEAWVKYAEAYQEPRKRVVQALP